MIDWIKEERKVGGILSEWWSIAYFVGIPSLLIVAMIIEAVN